MRVANVKIFFSKCLRNLSFLSLCLAKLLLSFLLLFADRAEDSFFFTKLFISCLLLRVQKKWVKKFFFFCYKQLLPMCLEIMPCHLSWNCLCAHVGKKKSFLSPRTKMRNSRREGFFPVVFACTGRKKHGKRGRYSRTPLLAKLIHVFYLLYASAMSLWHLLTCGKKTLCHVVRR